MRNSRVPKPPLKGWPASSPLRCDADFDLGGGTTFRKQINQRRLSRPEWKGVHHAGNSSGVVDGAAAMLLASKDYADKHGLKPRGRIVAYVNSAIAPR
jgi:acetyl-CoA C-acetyltransferase